MTAPAEILAILGRPLSSENPDVEYRLVERRKAGLVEVAFGRSRRGGATALVLGCPEPLRRPTRTSGLDAKSIAAVRVEFDAVADVASVIALECMESALDHEFASLLARICERLGNTAAPTLTIEETIQRWRWLFAATAKPDARLQQGLWGELWVMSQSTDLDRLLDAWRGPERAVADFYRGGCSLEVKCSSTPGVVHMSHSQAELGRGTGWILALTVERDEAGVSCEALLKEVASRAKVPARLYESLLPRESAVARPDLSLCFSLSARPSLFAISDVPRVRAVDPGVTDLRYKITLDFSKALEALAAGNALSDFGLRRIFFDQE